MTVILLTLQPKFPSAQYVSTTSKRADMKTPEIIQYRLQHWKGCELVKDWGEWADYDEHMKPYAIGEVFIELRIKPEPLKVKKNLAEEVSVRTHITTNREDPALTYGIDEPENGPVGQAERYLVLSTEERAKGFIRPVRRSYLHETCGAITTMGQTIAETYSRNPEFYGATYCATCHLHRPVGTGGEFVWLDDGSKVGT